MKLGTATLLLVTIMVGSAAGADSDLATILMRSTFKIEGPASQGTSFGTGFILGKPLAGDPAG